MSSTVDDETTAALAEWLDREPEPPAWFRQGFAPGDRIRVRINLECAYCLDPLFQACYERALQDDGRTGTVYDVGHDVCSCRWDHGDDVPGADHMGHDVWVTWDARRPYDDPELEGAPFDAHFAASELELLPAATEDAV